MIAPVMTLIAVMTSTIMALAYREAQGRYTFAVGFVLGLCLAMTIVMCVSEWRGMRNG